jgi:hypothetical protein
VSRFNMDMPGFRHGLQYLLERAKERWAKMTPEEREAERRQQRESWVRGEMGIGSDADEARERAAWRRRREALLADVWRNGT